MKCQVCEAEYGSKQGMSTHLRSHDMHPEQYTKEYLYDGERPKCKICGEPVKYQSFSFEQFCDEHNCSVSDPISEHSTLNNLFLIEIKDLLHPAQISVGSGRKVLWKCEENHVFEAPPANVSRYKNKCPCCSGRRLSLNRNNSLAAQYPELAKQWHSDNPCSAQDVLPAGKDKEKWKCSEGHVWRSSITNRVHNESGCPQCAGRQSGDAKECEICGDSFAGNNGLYTHIALSHDIELDDYKMQYSDKYDAHECLKCGESFISKQKLNKHIDEDHDESRKEFHAKYVKKLDEIPTCNARGCSEKVQFHRHYGFSSTCGQKECIIDCQVEGGLESQEKLSREEVDKRLLEDNFKIAEGGEYEYVHDKVLLECLDCGHALRRLLYTQLNSHYNCTNCTDTFSSEGEEEIASWLQEDVSCQVRTNLRNIIPPYEIDIYLPQHNLGIEYHGLYWHSEQNKPKQYHYNKFQKAKEKGTQILQFFEDQWRDKKDICKSMILHELGQSPEVIYARDCDVVHMMQSKKYRPFFEEHHIQGSANARWAIGLVHSGDLISCMSVRSPMHYDNADEIARFCHKKFHHIPGALSRLFTYAKQETDKDKFITYADLMHGDGSGYDGLGFEFSHRTALNYWYTDFQDRYSRQNFQATKNKTEREIAKEAGVSRIYGAGNYMFEFSLEESG